MSIRARKRIDPRVNINKAYQVILNPLVTEKATQLSEFNKVVFKVNKQYPANNHDHARPSQVVSNLLVNLRGHFIPAFVVSHNDVEPKILEFVFEIILFVVLINS